MFLFSRIHPLLTKPSAVLLLTIILTGWYLLLPVSFPVHDQMHTVRILQAKQALDAGQIPPRWAPGLSSGFGYPLFHFVYPLPYYLGAGLLYFNLSLEQAVHLLHFIATVAAVYGMYFWARKLTSSPASASLAAMVYGFAPYRLLNLYVRGALGESLLLGLLPWLFWALTRFAFNPTLFNLAVSASLVGVLVLTHNIGMLMFLPLAFIWTVILLKPKVKNLAKLLAVFVWGLLASVYFWLPAWQDKQLMANDPIYNYQDHFPFIKQLLWSPWGYGASHWGPNDDLSFQLGLPLWLGLLVGSIWWLTRGLKIKQKIISSLSHRTWTVSLAFVAISFYLMNIRSDWIWRALPVMAYFQFPWRWLLVTTLFASLLLAWVSKQIFSHAGKLTYFWIGLLSLSLLPSILWFKPARLEPDQSLAICQRFLSHCPLSPDPTQTAASYKLSNETALPLPKTVQQKPRFHPVTDLEASPAALILESQPVSPVEFRILLNPQLAGQVSLMRYYFPGWQAQLDGRELPLQPGTPYGQITASVPPGSYQLTIKFGQTAGWQVLNLVSLVSWLGLVLTLISTPSIKPMARL